MEKYIIVLSALFIIGVIMNILLESIKLLFKDPVSIFIMTMGGLFSFPIVILFLLECIWDNDKKKEDGE